ncbi:MAG TPA: DUF433 domain-containing protein [Chitinophagales bacterium]|nr:DUF433 domain-containing protein [Chitinophagales bacterium]
MLKDSKNIVVDPKHQFGQPTIAGTNIRVDVIKKLLDGGETKESLSKLYNLHPKQISDVQRFYKIAV